MNKILKIALTVVIFLLVAGAASLSLIVFDAAGNFATGTRTLPNSKPIGQAIVVYDPGLSGVPGNVASKIACDLQKRGYSVVVAGVKSHAAANLTGYDLIVIGGPVYMGKPAATIQAYVNNVNRTIQESVLVGYFGYGLKETFQNNQTDVNKEIANPPSGTPLSHTFGLKITPQDDMTEKCQELVNRFG
jgi:flavorubredoxin